MKLADYLAAEGVTDEQFAARVGVSRSSMSRLRRGLQRPDWDTMLAIQAATSGAVTPNDFASLIGASEAAS